MEKYQEIERSIIKTYRKEIWRPFVSALQDYELIEENDHIMVCISGGKDSFLLAKCMQEIQKHGNIPFTAEYVCMDPGYDEYYLEQIQDNAEIMNIPLQIVKSDIFAVLLHADFKNHCYFCAKMRRGYLYNKAKELGCNKIALGHHFDDVIETTLLSMFYGSEVKTMMPKLHSDNFEGLELIRPIFKVKESAIITWRNFNELTFINCACPFSEGCSLVNDGTSKRKEVKELIKTLKKVNPKIDQNIFTAMENVNMDCVLGYRKGKQRYTFLDDYDSNEDEES